jgi:hypothetical protein
MVVRAGAYLRDRNQWKSVAMKNLEATMDKMKIRATYRTTFEAMQPTVSVSMEPTLMI